METVAPGEQISFIIRVRDDDGVFYDPDSLDVYITRFVNQILYGPATYESGQVTRITTGIYTFSFTASGSIQPAVYTLKSVATTDDSTRYDYDYFEVIEPQRAKSAILDPPILYGKIKEIYNYGTMGQGLTDSICLIGHCDGIEINDPVRVTNMKEVVRMMQADPDSPLLRALLEAYNSGAQDIYVVAAAPMREYLPNLADRFTPFDEWGGNNFYEQYHERLTTTYEVIKEFDLFEIVVPVEAPYHDAGGVDFLNQLADYCEETFALVSQPVIGIIGTRVEDFASEDVDAMLEDSRLTELDDDGNSVFQSKGKYVLVVAGEGSFNHTQLPLVYTASLATAAASKIAVSGYSDGIIYKPLDQVRGLASRDLTKAQIKALSASRINPVIRNTIGRRGRDFQIVVATDNTLSPANSDYWSIATLRIVSKCIKQIKMLGQRRIGTIGFGQLQKEIDVFLSSLVANSNLKDYTFQMYRSPFDKNAAVVEVTITPFLQVREVTFQTTVGINE